MSITAVASELGEKRQRLQDIESGKQKVPEDIIVKYIDYFNIDANWLLTGKGQMLKNMEYSELSSMPMQVQEQKNSSNIDKNTGTWEQFALVPFYDVEASAGWGSLVDQELKIGEMAFRKDWLRARGLKPSHCALIKARGDSMEPTIYDGDVLLVDTQANTIKDDAIYIVHADHHLIIKRVQQALDGSLIIISDNSRYENQTIGAEMVEKVKVAGRVRWHGHEI